MYMEDILSEAVLINSKSAQINKLFYFAMKNIFTEKYYKKIDKFFSGNRIEIGEFSENNNIVAYTQNHKLYVNAHAFYNKKREDAVVYILHEMIHLLVSLPYFKELRQIETEIYKVIKKSLRGDLSEFFTGKKQALHSNAKQEALSYLMNGAISWKLMKPEGKQNIKSILSNSGIFDMNNMFWKKRF